MLLPRSSVFRSLLSAQARRTAPARVPYLRSRFWQQLGRRTYASGGNGGHGHSEGSELPWIIGSIGITAPCAFYLLQSGPDPHHEAHDAHDSAHGEPEEETAADSAEEDDGKEEEDKGETKKEDGDDDAKSENSGSDDEGKKDTPDTSDDEKDDESEPEPKSVKGKAKEEGQSTAAQNPKDPHNDPEESKKSEGTVESAKLQGTVDTSKRSPK